jgi:proteasome lid subunit RPN8/RPN11
LQNGLSEDLNICRDSEEYRSRGNIFNADETEAPAPVEVKTPPVHASINHPQATASEPTMIDIAMEKVNEVVAAVLASLPDISSVDLSMEKPTKSKGL